MAEEKYVFPGKESEVMENLPIMMAVFQLYGGYYHMIFTTKQLRNIMNWEEDDPAGIVSLDIPKKFETKVDGKKCVLEGENYPIHRADSTLTFVVYRDVTEQRRLFRLQRIRRKVQQDFYNEILDTTQDCIYWKDMNRCYTGVNKSFLDFAGYPSTDSIIGKTDEQLGWLIDSEASREDDLQILQGKITQSAHVKSIVNGKERDILVSKSPLFEQGKITGIVGSFVDVTETYERRRENERLNEEKEIALLEAEQAKDRMSEFIMRASHEMRTPLNAILGFTQLVRDDTDEETLRDYMRKINISGRLLADLVNDILDIRKIDDGSMQIYPRPMVLSDLLRDLDDMISVLAKKKNITFITDLSGMRHELMICDKVRLEQVLLNLLNNSIKFTDEGGEVTLLVKEHTKGKRISEYTFIVEDTGCGMSESFVERIFEPFAQENRDASKYGVGTGLGLTITKRIITLMRGTIDVESREGEGSRFTIKIPLTLYDKVKYDVEKKKPKAHKLREFSLKGLKLLAVEDNEINQEVIRGILEQEEIKVEIAGSGEECLKIFEAAEAGTFAGVLMDIHMPGMDGYETTRRLRSLEHPDAKRIPVVAMTADAAEEAIEQSQAAGMNGYVPKPLSIPDLKRTLSGVVIVP